MSDQSLPKRAFLRIDGWHGNIEQQILIVGETLKCWRIQAITATRLAGRNKWLNAGEEIVVPRFAVRIPRDI